MKQNLRFKPRLGFRQTSPFYEWLLANRLPIKSHTRDSETDPTGWATFLLEWDAVVRGTSEELTDAQRAHLTTMVGRDE